LLDETTAMVAGRLVAALRHAPPDQREAVKMLTSAFAHAVADDPRIARATFGQTGSISPAVERRQRQARRWAAAFVERVWRRYGLACAPPEELRSLALAVVGGTVDLLVDWLHGRD